MRIVRRLTLKVLRGRFPRRTVKLRLTLLYGGLFLASGVVLLIITAFLWGSATGKQIGVPQRAFGKILQVTSPAGTATPSNLPNAPIFGAPAGWQAASSIAQRNVVAGQLNFVATQQHRTDLHQLLLYCAIAIAIMAMLSVALGWWTAGRVLRPLRTITTTARDISANNLHERLDLEGPDDELKELGDTIDQVLGRLEGSFQSQRQFVANAAHELRTPLTTMRARLDVATGKPGPVPEETRILADHLHRDLDHVERLLENFLLLARAQAGPVGDDVELSLDLLAASALGDQARTISEMNLEVAKEGCPEARVSGNETLLARMVTNLIDNAVRHNQRHGWVRVKTAVEGDCARLTVENGGAPFDENAVKELARPFRRLGAERTGSDEGTGLGLSIVASVAETHGGRLELHARRDGGFEAVIELPVAVAVLSGAPA